MAREKQAFSIWPWCCCWYEADAACNCLCSLVCVCSPQPGSACTLPPAMTLLSWDHWRLRTSEERPWVHKKPRWWHLSLGNHVTCVASETFWLPFAEEPKVRHLSSQNRASDDHGSLLWAAWHFRIQRSGLEQVQWQWCGDENDCPGLAASLLVNTSLPRPWPCPYVSRRKTVFL